MRAIPEELTGLISDLERFLGDGLRAENLSKKARERREVFIRRIRDVKLSFPHAFKDKRGGADSEEEEEDDEEEEEEGGGSGDSNHDRESLQSERTDKDDDASEGSHHQFVPVPAQDLTSVFKAGYLDKRRKDHSFFGTEWQKRWCALSQNTFYYYGSDKDKQQKGEFSIDGYTVKMNGTLRKDSKKDFCFEVSAPDKRIYQFCASSLKEAEDWVQQIDFVLRDMSGIIPEDDDEEEQEMYDDVGHSADAFDDIYEELPEEDLSSPAPPPPPKVDPSVKPAPPPPPVDKSTDYQNYYQGLWDCTGDQPDELSFKRGDAIYILSREYQNYGWWVGEKNGDVGIVPKNYLMQLYAL